MAMTHGARWRRPPIWVHAHAPGNLPIRSRAAKAWWPSGRGAQILEACMSRETGSQTLPRVKHASSTPCGCANSTAYRCDCIQGMARRASPAGPAQKLTGEAIAYARNQWEYLIRYASDGRAPIDNNLLERDIRVFVTGRKTGYSAIQLPCKASATIYSSCLHAGHAAVDPHDWLAHV